MADLDIVKVFCVTLGVVVGLPGFLFLGVDYEGIIWFWKRWVDFWGRGAMMWRSDAGERGAPLRGRRASEDSYYYVLLWFLESYHMIVPFERYYQENGAKRNRLQWQAVR